MGNKNCLDPLILYLLGVLSTQLRARFDIPTITVVPTDVHNLQVLQKLKESPKAISHLSRKVLLVIVVLLLVKKYFILKLC